MTYDTTEFLVEVEVTVEEVTDEEISQVLSKWTGIPVARLVEGEREKLLRLDEELQKRVIGQDSAVEAVSSAILRAIDGLKDESKANAILGINSLMCQEAAMYSRTLLNALIPQEENK